MNLKDKILSYISTAGFGFVLLLTSAALVGGIVGVIVALFKGG